MRLAFLAPLVAIAMLLPAPAAPTAAGGAIHVHLSEILPDPDTAQNQREFVEIWNQGNLSVDITGWKVRDAPTVSGAVNTYTMPSWTLAPNGRVVVWGGGAADSHGPAWSNNAVWNNAGDGATLLDAAGTVIDWLGYGATTAPAGQEGHALLAKPDKGVSTALQGATWQTGTPTPGTATGAVTADIQVVVQNAAPTAAFVALPHSARPSTAVTVQFLLADANGAADLATWVLAGPQGTIAQGVGIPNPPPSATSPASGNWTLHLTVADKAGATGEATAAIVVQASDLRVEMRSSGPVTLPAARPGATKLLLGQATLSNDGDHAYQPLIDVSPFVGPANFEAQGHISIGLSVGNATTWVAYNGPLTALPPIAAGAGYTLEFRLDSVPAVLPGTYGTSFTVVPA